MGVNTEPIIPFANIFTKTTSLVKQAKSQRRHVANIKNRAAAGLRRKSRGF
jgi:hypothetical protein